MSLRFIFLFLVCALSFAPANAAEADFSGQYTGRLGETRALLELRVSGSAVSGTITRQDKPDITLKGSVVEGNLIGAASSRQGSGFFEGFREFGALVIILREAGSVSGQALEMRAEFSAVKEPAAELLQPSQTDSVSERDGKLVGTWTTERLVAQGDMILPVRTEMTLAHDGTFSERNDPNIGSVTGEWRNRSGKIETRKPLAEAWSFLAEYRLHGDHLITVAPEREPLVWERQRD